MDRTPQQWAYSALVGMSLLLAGWLWQLVSTLRDDVQRLQENKADRSAVEVKAADRWTGSQQYEYRLAVNAKFDSVERELEKCRVQLQDEINRLHKGK